MTEVEVEGTYYFLSTAVEILAHDDAVEFENATHLEHPNAPDLSGYVAGRVTDRRGKSKLHWFWPAQLRTEPFGSESLVWWSNR